MSEYDPEEAAIRTHSSNGSGIYDVNTYREPTKAEKIATVVVGTVILGFVGMFTWAGFKEEKATIERNKQIRAEREAKAEADREERERKRQETKDWLESERNKGNIVIRTHDNGYISITAEAYTKANLRSL